MYLIYDMFDKNGYSRVVDYEQLKLELVEFMENHITTCDYKESCDICWKIIKDLMKTNNSFESIKNGLEVFSYGVIDLNKLSIELDLVKDYLFEEHYNNFKVEHTENDKNIIEQMKKIITRIKK